MKIEFLMYIYIAICICMIAYNIVYVFILRHREKALETNSSKFEKLIFSEIERIKAGGEVSERHKSMLCRKLDRTAGITAFDKALEKMHADDTAVTERYLLDTFSVFEYLTDRYISKDTLKIAYFPYILYKYKILQRHESKRMKDALLNLLRSVNVYCRENTLRALYVTQDPELIASALKIIDKNLTFHHPKLICDGLMTYPGDREVLRDVLLDAFSVFSVQMRVNVLNFFRFGNIACEDEMLGFLTDESQDDEIRFSAIRYFEKMPSEKARQTIQKLAENLEGRTWEYQAIATSALKAYPDDITFRILVRNLSSLNWHIRQNSAISCVKLGYSYYDLISVFDGEDRYAREMVRYYLDKENFESRAVKI